MSTQKQINCQTQKIGNDSNTQKNKGIEESLMKFFLISDEKSDEIEIGNTDNYSSLVLHKNQMGQLITCLKSFHLSL